MDAERVAIIELRLKDLSAQISALQREMVLAHVDQPTEMTPEERTRSDAAWNDLMAAADEIGRLWSGPNVVEEIRLQRER